MILTLIAGLTQYLDQEIFVNEMTNENTYDQFSRVPWHPNFQKANQMTFIDVWFIFWMVFGWSCCPVLFCNWTACRLLQSHRRGWTEVETDMHEAIVQKDLTRVGKEPIFNYSCQVFKHICLLVGAVISKISGFSEWMQFSETMATHGQPRGKLRWRPSWMRWVPSKSYWCFPNMQQPWEAMPMNHAFWFKKGGGWKHDYCRWWFQIFIYYVHA